MKSLVTLFLFLQGCLIVLDDDCDPQHPEYEYTETDCYYTTRSFRVCNSYNCWNESRETYVCDEYYICREGVWTQ